MHGNGLALIAIALATKMDPSKAAKAFRFAASRYARSITECDKNLITVAENANALGALAGKIKPNEAQVICGRALARLDQELELADKPRPLALVCKAIGALVDHVKLDTARRICDRAITKTLDLLTLPGCLDFATESIRPLFDKLSDSTARQIGARAAAKLIAACRECDNSTQLASVAGGLAALQERLPSTRVQEAYEEIARRLEALLVYLKEPLDYWNALNTLAVMASKVEPTRMRRVCDRVRESCERQQSINEGYPWRGYLWAIKAAVGIVEDIWEHQAAGEVIESMSRIVEWRDPLAFSFMPRGLSALAKKLSGVQLCELLKHPACVGFARTVMLGDLSRFFQRDFTTLGQLLAFLQENHPEIDLASPPQKPLFLPHPEPALPRGPE